MNNFTFYSPTYFVFGKEEENNAGKYVKRFGGSKVLIHYGGGSVVRSGLLDRIKASLAAEGIGYVELGGVKPNPRSGLVYEGIEICKKENVDFVLAVGGGSTIDSSKAIAVGALYDGDFWDFYSGKAVEKALPVGTVLTIAAAGSEGSSGSVITKEEGMFKRSAGGEAMRPVFSILNPELTQTLPPYQTAAGVTDIMAHLLERYFTNTKNVEVTDRVIEGLLLTMVNEAPKVIANPNDYDARANVMWAGTLAHNGLCGNGKVEDWSSHRLEHEISALYDVAHGAGLAVMVPAWMTFVAKKNPHKVKEFAINVMGVDAAAKNDETIIAEGIEALKSFYHNIGMTTSMRELTGVENPDIEALVKSLRGNMGDTLGFYVPLSMDDCAEIYRLAL